FSTPTAPLKWLILGLSSTLFGIFSLIWTPFDLVMEERLRMRPGLPAFDWWYEPPDVIRLKVYLFNVTNAERYMSGEDHKLQLEEVGPIVFREVVTHKEVIFNDNDTMSYTVHRNAIWDPTLNTIDLNATLMYPNLPVLLTASMFWNTNYFMKLLLNSAFKVTDARPIVQKTIYEILYNNTDPFLSIAHLTMPSFASHANIGLIPLIYPGYGNRMNVFMGTKSGYGKYLLIDKFNGSRSIPGRGESCQDNLLDSNNNIMYRQFISNGNVIRIFNNLMCRTITLIYEEEVYRQGFKAYKFVLDHNAYNRTAPLENDCYKSSPTLTDGLTDLAPCWFGK
ncbi:SCRB7, partial [Trypoxylus dichotomus]